MLIDRAMRQKMLDQVRLALMDATADQTISFYSDDVSPVLLCSVQFNDLITYNSGDQITYRFQALDGSYNLRWAATASGRVSYFIIDGKVPDGSLIPVLIRGSVGKFGSGADMEFNKIDWSTNTIIVLSDLLLIMNQGT